MSYLYINLIKEAETALIKGDKKIALLKYKQCLEKGVKQSGSITKKMIKQHIIEIETDNL